MAEEPTSIPRIVVEPPGPKARKIIERDQRVLMQSFVRWYPLVVSHARDYIVYDVDGNAYVDLNSGLGVLNIGSCNKLVVEAIKRQVEKLIHYSLTDFYYEEAVELAERLVNITPIEKPSKVFFTNSGAESIEASIKVSRYSTGRQYIIAFLGGFHGRTMGAVSLTASKVVQRKGFSPLLPGVVHVPYPYPYRCPFQVNDPEECGDAVIGYLEEWVFAKLVDPNEVAAIVIEPILGEGGYVVPPNGFLPKLRKLAEKHGIVFVADEVQSGFARTGKWFAIEHWNVKPDVIALAKAIAGGLPLGAIVGREQIMSIGAGGHATTFGGNPVAAAAGLAVIDYIEKNRLWERAAKLGGKVMKILHEAMNEVEMIGDVRGKGLMIGIELVKNKYTREPATKELAEILIRLFKRGYLVIGAGISTIRIAPPLTIPENVLEKAVTEIIAEIRRVCKEKGYCK